MTDEPHPGAPKDEESLEAAPSWFEPAQMPETPEQAESLRVLSEALEESAQTFDMAHYLRLFGGPAAVVDAVQPLPH